MKLSKAQSRKFKKIFLKTMSQMSVKKSKHATFHHNIEAFVLGIIQSINIIKFSL